MLYSVHFSRDGCLSRRYAVHHYGDVSSAISVSCWWAQFCPIIQISFQWICPLVFFLMVCRHRCTFYWQGIWIHLEIGLNFFPDILVDAEDDEHINNLTNEFFNSDRISSWAVEGVSPVTFAVHTKNETPGIHSEWLFPYLLSAWASYHFVYLFYAPFENFQRL